MDVTVSSHSGYAYVGLIPRRKDCGPCTQHSRPVKRLKKAVDRMESDLQEVLDEKDRLRAPPSMESDLHAPGRYHALGRGEKRRYLVQKPIPYGSRDSWFREMLSTCRAAAIEV